MQSTDRHSTITLQVNEQTLHVTVTLQWIARDAAVECERWPEERVPWLRVTQIQSVNAAWSQFHTACGGLMIATTEQDPLLQVLSMAQERSQCHDVLQKNQAVTRLLGPGTRRSLEKALKDALTLQTPDDALRRTRATLQPCWWRYFPPVLYRDTDSETLFVGVVNGALSWWRDMLLPLGAPGLQALQPQRLALAVILDGTALAVLLADFVHTPGVPSVTLGYDTCRVALPSPRHNQTLLIQSLLRFLRRHVQELGLQRIELPVTKEQARAMRLTVERLGDETVVLRLPHVHQNITLKVEPTDTDDVLNDDTGLGGDDDTLRRYTLAMRGEGLFNAQRFLRQEAEQRDRRAQLSELESRLAENY